MERARWRPVGTPRFSLRLQPKPDPSEARDFHQIRKGPAMAGEDPLQFAGFVAVGDVRSLSDGPSGEVSLMATRKALGKQLT